MQDTQHAGSLEKMGHLINVLVSRSFESKEIAHVDFFVELDLGL